MAKTTTFIRWAGGKSWLVPYVHDLIEGLEYNNYYEPFMGGASVFFSLDDNHNSFLSDINKELINTFKAVKDNPEKIISILKTYKTDEESYYEIREKETNQKYESAARFLYLNANSFNGIYRVNKNGKYNVPYGKIGREVNYERLLEVSKKLTNAHISCHDFYSIDVNVQKGDLIFLDPPYTCSVNHHENCFIQYNQKLFSLNDQYRLASLIRNINDKDAYYILTNAAEPIIKNIFEDKGRFIVRERNSLIGGKNSYRGTINEYIFTNIPERSVHNG